MWKHCKIAARWGAFIGMLVALVELLSFFSYPTVTYPNGTGWISVHGSYEIIKAAQREFDDKTYGIGHTLDGLDYVRWRVNKYSPSTVTMRIPYGVFLIPMALICVWTAIPVLINSVCYFIVALCWLLPPTATNLKPLQIHSQRKSTVPTAT